MNATTNSATIVQASQAKRFNVLGHSILVRLSSRTTAGDYYVFEVVTPPGLGIPPHVHDREDELIHVLEGEYSILLGDNEQTARTGDQIFFPRHIPHAFRNVGNAPGRTLWTVVPGGNFEEFFEQLAALPSDGEPDLALVAEIFARYGMEILMPQEA
jgi:quercetin dioxygenase-like cupin family protein